MEDLPDLITGRLLHGCGHYVDNNNDIVRLVLFLLLLIFIYRSTWLLVDILHTIKWLLLKYLQKDHKVGELLDLYLMLWRD